MHIRLAKLGGPAKLNKVLCKQRDDFSRFPAGRVILIKPLWPSDTEQTLSSF